MPPYHFLLLHVHCITNSFLHLGSSSVSRKYRGVRFHLQHARVPVDMKTTRYWTWWYANCINYISLQINLLENVLVFIDNNQTSPETVRGKLRIYSETRIIVINLDDSLNSTLFTATFNPLNSWTDQIDYKLLTLFFISVLLYVVISLICTYQHNCIGRSPATSTVYMVPLRYKCCRSSWVPMWMLIPKKVIFLHLIKSCRKPAPFFVIYVCILGWFPWETNLQGFQWYRHKLGLWLVGTKNSYKNEMPTKMQSRVLYSSRYRSRRNTPADQSEPSICHTM